jgi:hypothetical protein
VERKDGGRPGAVERAIVEHAAAVRAQPRCSTPQWCGRSVGRGEMGVGPAGKPEERESESGVFRIFLATQCKSVEPFGRRRGPPTAASDGFLSDQMP